MNLIKRTIAALSLTILTLTAFAQDAVIIEEGNFLRGTIQGTDFTTVRLQLDDQSVKIFNAKDIKEFLWNGHTYVSKPVVVKNKMEHHFYKLEEAGVVNLYSMGDLATTEEPQEKRVRVRPSVGVGLGSGGFGGVGLGGGITFGGGGGRNSKKRAASRNVTYYIEKPGSGPMLFVPLNEKSAEDNARVKQLLLQKLTNDEDLAERIKATETFDVKSLQALIAAYNVMQK